MATSPTHEATYAHIESSPATERDFPRLVRFEDYWGTDNVAASTVSAKAAEGSNKARARRLSDEVDKIMAGLPYLIQALEETSDSHPFIRGMINAFKLVFNLEITRHDNDKKVKLLLLSVKNMVTGFLHLRDIEPNHPGVDNRTIERRLAELVPSIERDIFECANACDTYSKKTHLVRVVQRTAWNEIMQRWVGAFSKYKSMVLDAVKVYTRIVDDVDSGVLDELLTKTDLILAFLENVVTPEERSLASIINQAGGLEVARGNPHVLEALLAVQRQYENPAVPGPDIVGGIDHLRTSRSADNYRQRRRVMIYSPQVTHLQGTAQPLPDLQILLQELQDTSPDAAIFTNFPNLKRKLQLVNAYQPRYMQVIPNMGASQESVGQHETVHDPVVSEFWREMQWPHTVDATIFITTVHDHCQEVAKRAGGVVTESGGTNGTWALACIGPMKHQAILEVLDPDAIGVISIRKMNWFLSQRPEEWSLLKWLAYWGLGWQVANAHYRRKIYLLLERMDTLRASDSMRYSNQPSALLYMNEASRRIYQMATSFRDDFEHSESALLPHFQRYIDAEEGRIRLALERVNYDVSDFDTLALVLGDQPYLERTLYLLLYLLLVRHHALFREATSHLLHPKELPDALSVVCLIHDAFQLRCEELHALFSKRCSDPLQRVMKFACSMFALASRPPPSQPNSRSAREPGPMIAAWSMSTSREVDGGEDAVLLDELLRQAFPSSPTDVLKYPPHHEVFYSYDEYKKTGEDTQVTDGRVLRILGRWTMLVTWEADVDGTRMPCRTVYIVDLHSRPGGDPINFTGISRFDYAWPSVSASLIGRCTGADDWGRGLPTYYTFTKTFDGPTPPEFYQVRMDSDGRTLIGVRDYDSRFSSSNKAWVVMKKDIAPEIMVYYPSREELIADRTSALKNFMLSAVWHQVRQRCRPMLFAERQIKRMARLLYLTGKESISTLTTIEKMERICLANTLVPADSHFLSYKSLEPKNTQLTRDLRRPTGSPSHIPLVSPRAGFQLIQWLIPEHRRRVRFELPGGRPPRGPFIPLKTTSASTLTLPSTVPPAFERSLLFGHGDTPVIPPVIPPRLDSPMWQDRRWEHPTVIREPEYIVIQPRTHTPSQWSTSGFSSEQSVEPRAHGGHRGRSSLSQFSTPLSPPKTEPSQSGRSPTSSVPPFNDSIPQRFESGTLPMPVMPPPVPPFVPQAVPLFPPGRPPELPPGFVPVIPPAPFAPPPRMNMNSTPSLPSPRPSSPSDSTPPPPSPPQPVVPGRLEDEVFIPTPPPHGSPKGDNVPSLREHFRRDPAEGRSDLQTVQAIQTVLGMFLAFFVACLSIICLFVYYSGGSLTVVLERKGNEL